MTIDASDCLSYRGRLMMMMTMMVVVGMHSRRLAPGMHAVHVGYQVIQTQGGGELVEQRRFLILRVHLRMHPSQKKHFTPAPLKRL